MAQDTLVIYGTTYNNVAGIKATDNNSNTMTYIRPTGTKSISANGTNIDVTDYAAVDVNVAQDTSVVSGLVLRTLRTIDWSTIQQFTNVGDYGFAGMSIFNPPELPSTVHTINKYAFRECTALSWTSLPNSITSISSYAFYGCTNLALTSLPTGWTSPVINEYVFYNCSKLAIASIPSSVTSIYQYAFYGCTSLSQMSLPNSITSINGYAFYKCTNLSLTSLPSSLLSIGDRAFYQCTSLELTTLPSTLTTIGSYAFYECSSLIDISSTAAITTVGTAAFNGTSSNPMNLKSASFPNMATSSSLGIVFGSSTAVNACQLLEFADLGYTPGLAASSLANCYSLETLVLRKTASVCTISSNTFSNTPMAGYNSKTGTVYVPSALISSYQSANNWQTLYNNGTVTFVAIEGSEYEL